LALPPCSCSTKQWRSHPCKPYLGWAEKDPPYQETTSLTVVSTFDPHPHELFFNSLVKQVGRNKQLIGEDCLYC
jgi:hypothetical protein